MLKKLKARMSGVGRASGTTAVTTASAEAPVLFHEKYELGMKLGAGAFAQVREANLRGRAATGAGGKMAVKILDLRAPEADGKPGGGVNRKELKLAQNEANVWQAVGSHPNVVMIYETFLDETFYYIVMELCVCSLMQRLDEDGAAMRGGMDITRIFREMLLGLGSIHAAGVAHLDVKPDNFLFGGDDEQTVKVADFGLAVMMPKKGLLFGVSGTPPFMSPEMLIGKGYDQKTDVWSLGATAYLMMFGEFPYMPKKRTSAGMKEVIHRGIPPPRYKPAIAGVPMPPDDAVRFIQGLMDRAVDQRCSIDEALNMPFVHPATSEKGSTVWGGSSGSNEALAELKPAIHRARTLAHELKEKADPTKQRGMDDLLQRCQETTGGSIAANFGCLRRSFSDELHDKGPSTPKAVCGRAKVDPSRFGTHNGVTGPALNFFESGSNASTASGKSSSAMSLASLGLFSPLPAMPSPMVAAHLAAKLLRIPEGGFSGGDKEVMTVSLGEFGVLTGKPVRVVSL